MCVQWVGVVLHVCAVGGCCATCVYSGWVLCYTCVCSGWVLCYMCVQWVGVLTWFSEGLYKRSDQCTAAGLAYTLAGLGSVKEVISKHLLVQDDSTQSGEGVIRMLCTIPRAYKRREGSNLGNIRIQMWAENVHECLV